MYFCLVNIENVCKIPVPWPLIKGSVDGKGGYNCNFGFLFIFHVGPFTSQNVYIFFRNTINI